MDGGLLALLFFIATPLTAFFLYKAVCALRGLTPKNRQLTDNLNHQLEQLKKSETALQKRIDACNEKESFLIHREEELNRKKEQFEEEKKNRLADFQKQIHALAQNSQVEYPRLASAIADLETLYYAQAADYLVKKQNPAYTAAETVRKLREDTKKVLEEKKLLEYQFSELKYAFSQKEFRGCAGAPGTTPSSKPESVREDEKSSDSVSELVSKYTNLKLSIEQKEEYVLSQISCVFGPQTVEGLHGILTTEKYRRAIDGNFMFVSPISVSSKIKSGDNVYETTLTSCTCPDFHNRKEPCKHMLWLALQLGLLVRDRHTYQSCLDKLEKSAIDVRHKEMIYREHDALLQKRQFQFESDRKRLDEKEKIIHEEEQAYPYMANLLTMYDQEVDKIRLKKMDSRAYKSSEVVKTIKAEKKELLLERNLLRNQLFIYESLFPWLEEFKEVNVKDAVQYATEASENDDYETVVKKWLSPEEFARLSRKEKLQLALDRYQHRQKTDWEIGIEYERYIGFLYESKGYTVKYTGATMGLHDMGRDILAEKDSQVLVIQCKRWAADKTIHEKHIFQLFGTSFIMHLQDPAKEYIPVFYTTATLSELASQCSSGLHIRTYEKYPFGDYPLIKCNVGHDENGLPTKIYHLPFDQQYDRIIIDPSKGERYAATIEEAESAGFRHAYKWSGT